MATERSTTPALQHSATAAVTTLIDELLAEQRQLTAVEKFSRLHEAHAEPQLAPHYRDLIPLTAPRPGEQYAFEVNLDQCSGCKGCVTACHSLNGLDEDESWREVGFLVGEAVVPIGSSRREEAHSSNSELGTRNSELSQSLLTSAATSRFGNKIIPLQQTVTTACHHCVEPGCLLGCPVLAYDKDPATGIVRHLDDQCIGCSYCILKCPYDVPKYSAKRGIVRKCDMCHGRLAEGEAPACVQACPNEAIRITLVKPAAVSIEFRPQSRSSRREEAHASNAECGIRNAESEQSLLTSAATQEWLPDAPDPAITLPTTRYLSTKPNALLRSADHAGPKPQPAHWPLVLMLVLTQAGIGGLLAVALLGSGTGASLGLVERAPRPFFSTGEVPAGLVIAEAAVPLLATVSFTLLVAGLAASVFHLGQPRKAWRVWLGWRTSWLSREAIALNAFAGVATAAVGVRWADQLRQVSGLPDGFATLLQKAAETPAPFWGAPLLLLGLVGVFAQVMVYADTHRRFWRLGSTAPRFYGSTLVLGTALSLVFFPSAPLATALMAFTLLKLGSEVAVLKHADSDSEVWTQLRRTAALQCGMLRPVLALRLLLGLAGGVLLPFCLLVGSVSPVVAAVAFPLCLLGELAERYLFFTSVAPDKMPGLP